MRHAPSSIQTALALRQAIWRKGDPRWSVCGIPATFYNDHGSDFTSKHLEQVAADLHMSVVFSTAGKPRGRESWRRRSPPAFRRAYDSLAPLRWPGQEFGLVLYTDGGCTPEACAAAWVLRSHGTTVAERLRWLRIDSFDRRAVNQQLAQDEMTVMRAVA